jgi:hypothetical protein
MGPAQTRRTTPEQLRWDFAGTMYLTRARDDHQQRVAELGEQSDRAYHDLERTRLKVTRSLCGLPGPLAVIQAGSSSCLTEKQR